MHVNKSLPPVGIKVLIVLPDTSTIEVRRDKWITNRDDELEFHNPNNDSIIKINRDDIRWMYT